MINNSTKKTLHSFTSKQTHMALSVLFIIKNIANKI